MQDLNWTGERLVTSLENDFLVYEHLHRYAFARKLCSNKVILDIASGEGYGSYLLSQVANHVYGVDIDAASVLHAKEKYKQQARNISFKVGSTSAIPLDDNSVDVAVSFETIEHHNEHEEMIMEIKRVLKPDGMLVISSPDKDLYKQRAGNNPFHIKELNFEGFKFLMESHFTNCTYFKQCKVVASLIIPIQKTTAKFYTFDGDYTSIQEDLQEDGTFNKYYFNLAVCSDELYDEIQTASIFNAVKSLNNLLEKSRTQILKSTSYKLGNWIVVKLRFIKKLLPNQIRKSKYLS